MEDTQMKEPNSQKTLQDGSDSDEDKDEIEIVLKPMNITAIHKREVTMTVNQYSKVGDFAQTLINIMGLKGYQPSDANFLITGKTADHSKTFYDQGIQKGAKIIFTLKRKIAGTQAQSTGQTTGVSAPQKSQEQIKASPVQQNQNQQQSPQQPKYNQEERKQEQKKPLYQEEVQFQSNLPSNPAETYGRQADGTFKSIFDRVQTEDLNQQNLQMLIEMGYDYTLAVKALRGLRDNKKYNPVGEVQKAIDWINDYLEQEQIQQIQIMQNLQFVEEKQTEYLENQVIKQSIEEQKKPIAKKKEERKEQQGVSLKCNNCNLSEVFSWGNGLQGQLGVQDFQDLQPRPLCISGLQNIKISQIACGANHTVALTLEGKVYFWGQYVHPLKENEPPKYGRILAPKLQTSLQNHFITNIQAGSSHSLALNDYGQIYSWGYGVGGQLGINIKQNLIEAQRVQFDSRIYIKKISAGVAHSSAITMTGQLFIWGQNSGCQLGYSKEMKESLIPILFGGKIQVDSQTSPNKPKRPIFSQQDEEMKNEDQEEEKKESKDQQATQYDIGFNYIDVVCGSSQTLAIIDKSPYLLIWGNGDPIAKTFSEVFNFDRPIQYDCGGKLAVILTEKGNIYKINLEKGEIEKLQVIDRSKSEIELEDEDHGVVQLACGSDFVLVLKNDGNVYGLGQNKSGQLGIGDYKAKDQFALIESLLNEQVLKIYAGNQHACCIVDNKSPFLFQLEQLKLLNNQQGNTQMEQDQTLYKFMTVNSEKPDQFSELVCHKHILLAYFDDIPTPDIWLRLNEVQAQMLLELMYGQLGQESIYEFIIRYITKIKYFKLLDSVDMIISFVNDHVPQKQLLIRLLNFIRRQLTNNHRFFISFNNELDEDQRELYPEFYRERNRILIEVSTIQQEERNRQINRIRDPTAFSSFSYYRGLNFADERRRIQEDNANRARQLAIDQIRDEAEDMGDDDY